MVFLRQTCHSYFEVVIVWCLCLQIRASVMKVKFDSHAFHVTFIYGHVQLSKHWSKTTVNYWMTVERHQNLKEEVGDSIPGCEISSLLDRIACQAVNYLKCFDVGLSAFRLKKKEKRVIVQTRTSDLRTKGCPIPPQM